ncbi:MAG: leucine-rich repeat domain-containing protein [Lachnospiraceae bacterium]|nr:leucine-rich repeat domain-containing protein [Lachnospiraceae bacterium]
MKNRLITRKLMSLCLIPALLLAGACAQAGADEEITIATKAASETTTAASEDSTTKESDGPDRDEVNLDGGGFQCDWHEAVELTEEDALPEEELPVAFAEDENFWYDIYEDHVEVVNYIGTDTVVEVPATYEGLPVTVLGQIESHSWGSYMPFMYSDVEEVILPDGLLAIGNYAFFGCENLEKIVIPDSVTTIGILAFCGCENLEEIAIPDSVTTIGSSAFGGIDYIPWYENLTDEFVIVGDGILIKYNGDDTSVVIPDGVKNICGAFWDDEDLVSVTIPDSVTRITSCAFESCTSLESFTIPESVVEIDLSFNYGCDSLVTVDIPESVTVLTDSFKQCDSLKEVTGAENVTVLSGFGDCKYLEHFPFAEGLVEIGASAFSDSGLTEADLPQSLKIIGSSAFCDCLSLTEVKNGQNVIMVRANAFKGSAWFESITDYFVTVGKNVLIGYNGEDTEVVVPDTVTYLGGAFSCYQAAYSDDELLSVTIPASVRGICGSAFDQHPNLEELTILGENVVFGSGACGSLALKSFTVPEGTKIITSSMFSLTELQEIVIPDSVVIIGVGAFYYHEPVFVDYGTGETAPETEGSIKTVVIPDSVLMIGDSAFCDCKDLTDITIPASVTRIGEDVFEGCSEDLTIHGAAGSRAESYAEEYGINFVGDIGEK